MVGDGVDVGSRVFRSHDDNTALPVVGAAPGVVAAFDPVFVDSFTHGCNLDAFYFFVGDGGDVEVEERSLLGGK